MPSEIPCGLCSSHGHLLGHKCVKNSHSPSVITGEFLLPTIHMLYVVWKRRWLDKSNSIFKLLELVLNIQSPGIPSCIVNTYQA